MDLTEKVDRQTEILDLVKPPPATGYSLLHRLVMEVTADCALRYLKCLDSDHRLDLIINTQCSELGK